MTSPCGKIRIPLNESQDEHSQIEEFLRDYKGEGIQHIALGTNDIFASVEAMRARGVRFQDTIDTYFEGIDARVPGHGEDVARLKANKILLDGAPTEGQGLLLQIFTENMIGPIFFEQDVLVYLSYVMVPLVWWVVQRSRPGVLLRAAGDLRGRNLVVDADQIFLQAEGRQNAADAGGQLSLQNSHLR
jgi:hypothetical protein